MKKIIVSLGIFLLIISFNLFINGCAVTKDISEKSGAQLWGENCNRCHNAPTMDQYNKDQWDMIGSHMRIRANITSTEAEKIVSFLQGAQ